MTAPVLAVRGARLEFGPRTLWRDLDLDVGAGEFVAVLGPNGTGKTSLLRAILGQQQLTAGTVEVPAGRACVGYIPQQRLLPEGTPLRARDLVALGVDGARWGLPLPRAATRRRVDELLATVGASGYANAPVARLSGGEQQRLRVGQAIANDPVLLLCDEPLLSLDIANQRMVSALIDAERRRTGAAVLFVTHDVNPVLDVVDRVLYLAGGTFRIGTPDEVLRSEVLSALYGTPVDVFRAHGRIVVVGAPEQGEHHEHTEATELAL
ncbi:MAG: metal ABC transporter ATP-binding protein [Microbacteriaceae bacterium]